MSENSFELSFRNEKYEVTKYKNTLRTTDKQFCKYCGKFKTFNEFYDGKQNCKKCIEYRRNNHDKHREKANERQRKRYEEDEEYRKKKQEQNKERDKRIVTCDVCNKSMSQRYYYEHVKTKKHHINLEFNKLEK